MKFFLGRASDNAKELLESNSFTDYKTGVSAVKIADSLGCLRPYLFGLIVEADDCNSMGLLHGSILYRKFQAAPVYKIPIPKGTDLGNIESVYVSTVLDDDFGARQWVYAKYKNEAMIKNWCVRYDKFTTFGYTTDEQFKGHEV